MGVIRDAVAVLTKGAGLTFPGFGGQSWYGGSGGWSWPLRQVGEREYRMLVGNGEDSSIVAACVNWIANSAVQAIPSVRRYTKDDALGNIIRGHPASQLVLHPTYDAKADHSYYSWIPLIKATIIAFLVDGNAYWLKVRSPAGRVVQVWYVPTWMMVPRWPLDGSEFISHYDYIPSSSIERIKLLPSEVVHFRDGIDPNNTRLGLSSLKTLLREIFTDEEAARWTASLLKNNSVPGIVVAPGAGGGIPGPEDVKEIKARFMAEFTGDHRGEPIVMSGPTEIKQYGYSPEAMRLGDLRDIPEERVSAVLGVPAAVVGLGTGLQATKVGATMSEMVDLGWQNGVIPRLRTIALEITDQLVPEFSQGDDDEFEFDTSRVPIMATYHKLLAETEQQNYRWGLAQRGEARHALGFPATKDDEIYVLQSGASTVTPDGEIISGKDIIGPAEPVAPADQAALDAAALTPALPPPSSQLALPSGKALTSREAEVLDLLTKGQSNRAIADALVISERTVERHVAAILAKRGVKSRLALLGVEIEPKSVAVPDVRDQIAELADLLRDRDNTQQVDVLRELEKSAARRDEALLAGLREIAGREITISMPGPRAMERVVERNLETREVTRVIERPIAAGGAS